MLIVAQHAVTDPAVFWPTAAQAPLPDDVRLLQVLPSIDGRHGVCLWQAESVERVREIVNAAVGHVSRTEFFPVEEQTAVGLAMHGVGAEHG